MKIDKKIFLFILLTVSVISLCAYLVLSNSFSCKAQTVEKEIVITAASENAKDQEEITEIDESEVLKEQPEEKKYDFSDLSHWNLTISGWEKLSEKDYYGAFAYTKKCLELYEEKARLMAKGMKRFVSFGHEDDYAVVNDVATSRYIMGETYMRQKKYDEAIEEFNLIIKEYPYAQCWDPKGWFWKVAEISKKNVDKINKLKEEKKSE
ncbi:MAG: hypothetical protein HQ579_05470 [Candidatus Omnitrophica bacterium]|nr:hypothetical protein [Candidatus Omnitrophota bacterium]